MTTIVPENPVHPRACGEHRARPNGRRLMNGSSPRLRGTRDTSAPGHVGERFIPAPAGNTCACRQVPHICPVHPRACGEHACCRQDYCCVGGSSPRLRGTHAPLDQVAGLLRFIPAPAGNTIPVSIWHRVAPVHPRACGEHTASAAAPGDATGSSPRLRGTRIQKHYRSAR